MKRRRLRRALALSALGLIVLSSTSAGVSSLVSQPAVAAALREQASVLAQRSPGARGLALLLTKHKRPPAPVAAEHAAGPKPTPPPVFGLTETGPEGPQLALAPPLPGAVAIPPAAAPESAPLAALPLEAVPPGGPGGGILPIGGGPGPGGPIFVGALPPGGGGGGPIDITPSPTPEPGVWAMLGLGFFGVGAALRRRRRGLADGAHP